MTPHRTPHRTGAPALRPMPRRALLALLPMGALAACTGDDEEPAPQEPGGAELSSPPADLAPDPVEVHERAEVVDFSTLSVPLEMEPMIVVDPGWSATPLCLGGHLLGYANAEDRLQFTAVKQDGTVLWTAERPLGCTAAALTRDGDRPVAVLASVDESTDGELISVLAGYDVRTGAQLWTGVAGAVTGPGLVIGEPGSRAVLDAGSGSRRLAEEDLDGGRILAEHAGTILHTAGQELVALGPDGAELWRIDLPGGLDAAAAWVPREIDSATGWAVVTDGDAAGTVVDLADGTIRAEKADAVARDHVMEVTVVAAGPLVRGLDAEGEELWRHQDPEPLAFLTAGERLVYAVRPQEGTLVVLDSKQGTMVHPYDVDKDAPLAVPELFTADSAAAIRVDDEARYLVTTEFDPDFGTR